MIFHRSRRSLKLPKLALSREERRLQAFHRGAMARRPTGSSPLALEAEREQWDSVGFKLEFVET